MGDSSCIQTTGVGYEENNPYLALQSEARLISRFSAYSVPSRDVCLEPSLHYTNIIVEYLAVFY